MFAILSLEQDPPTYKDIVPTLHTWLWVVGSLCAIGLLIWAIVWALSGRRRSEESDWGLSHWIFLLFALVAAVAYLGFVGLNAPVILHTLSSVVVGPSTEKVPTALATEYVRDWLLNVGSAAALLAVSFWPLRDLFVFRWRIRRIWAIARLSLKEAIRRKILWVFLVVLLFFLFVMWFLPSKPEDQIRTYVQTVFFVIAGLLIVVSGLLASISIPADIRNQTIHTIFTKPVERFELVLGRFFGYALLITVVLIGLITVSLLYLLQEIHPEAVRESLKARVPIYGDLSFYENDVRKDKATMVAKEWTYRSYITSARGAPSFQEASFSFQDVPANLGKRDSVTCEYAFDVYRTSKGAGVACRFFCRTWHWNEGPLALQKELKQSYLAERGDENTGDPDFNSFLDSWLILKYGCHEVPAQEITDLHTFSVTLPAALFQDPRKELPALEAEAAKCPQKHKDLVRKFQQETDATSRKEQKKNLQRLEAKMPLEEHKQAFLFRVLPDLQEHVKKIDDNPKAYESRPRLDIRVACDSPGQYIGMARYDFYVLDDEWPFWVNFFGGAVGLWMFLMLVIAINVMLSTYLSAIISWIVSLVWLLMGVAREHITSLAQGTSAGGGPMESLYRLVHRETITGVPEQTAVFGVAARSDELTRYLFRGLLYVIPDPDRFWYTNYVAEGFSVSFQLMCMSGLEVLKFGIPFALMAYYLMKWREVASAQ
jgi:hypothetical protein